MLVDCRFIVVVVVGVIVGAVAEKGIHCVGIGGRGPPPMCDTSFLHGCCKCEALLGKERNQITGEGGHTGGKAWNAISPPWFRDKLKAGDGCGVFIILS